MRAPLTPGAGSVVGLVLSAAIVTGCSSTAATTGEPTPVETPATATCVVDDQLVVDKDDWAALVEQGMSGRDAAMALLCSGGAR